MKKSIILLLFISTIIIEIMSNSNSENICSKGVDKGIRREYTTYLNVLANVLNDYEKLSNSDVTISCQIDIRTIISNFTKKMDNKIIETVDRMNTLLKEVNELIPTKIDIVDAIQQGDFCSARFQLLENGKLNLSELIPIVYGNNLTSAGKLVEFLNALPELDDTISGYRYLFVEMKKNGHLYSTILTSMAYQILNVFHTKRSKNPDFIFLRDNLPASYKRFPWNAIVMIINKRGEHLFILPDDNLKYDKQRRIAQMWHQVGCGRKHCQWKIIPVSNGTFFYITNNQVAEYLYADSNEFAQDNQRRNIFTWAIVDRKGDTGNWQLEPIENSEYFKIKNVFWNEYLYIDQSDLFKFPDKNCRHVYTWRPGGCEEDGCQWSIRRA